MKLTIVALVISFGARIAICQSSAPSQLFLTTELHDDRIVVASYVPVETVNISLSNIDVLVPTPALGYDALPLDLKPIYIGTSPDYRLLLLAQGTARILNESAATAPEKEAQAAAQSARLGAWARLMPPPEADRRAERPNPRNRPHEANKLRGLLRSVFDFGRNWLLPLGLVSFVGGLLYKKFYIQRRLRLLLLGQASSGKTALSERILDPEVEARKLLSLAQSTRLERRKRNRHITHGRFELYPVVADVPGPRVGIAWDELSRKWFRPPHAIVLVVAPTGLNTKGDQQEKYVHTQLGYAEALISGALGAKKTRKPAAVVLFMNKFDLFSAHPPNDSSAAESSKSFAQIFAEHSSVIRDACKKRSIPFIEVVGSAVKGWGSLRLVEKVGDALYK